MPREGTAGLANEEVLARLRAAFPFVVVDQARGKAIVEKGIKRHDRVSPTVYEMAGAPKGSGVEHHRRHRERMQAGLAHATHVSFGDAADKALDHTLVWPDEGFLFVAEETWELELIERCAKVLEYESHEI